MKTLIALFALSLGSTAFANGLDDALNANAQVAAVHTSAVQLLAGGAAGLEALRVGQVDCSAHPTVFGQVEKDFCQFSATATYGWYADPNLVFVVTGYVKNGRNLARPIADADLMITGYQLNTPPRSGLE